MKHRLIALLLALALVFSLCACGSTAQTPDPTAQPDDRYDPEPGNKTGATPAALVSVVYPERAEYPDASNWDAEKADAWFEQARERRMTEIPEQSALDGFFSASARQYLDGTDGENRVCSPVNIYMALAMLAELTAGESRQQLLDLLDADSLEALRSQAGAVWNKLYQNDGATTSILASSLWLNEQVSFHQTALDNLAQYYHASSFRGTMGDPAYDRMLQDWINEQTGGLLQEQASNLKMDPRTLLALATTIYYKARWSNEFYEGETYPELFHGTKGDTTAQYLHREGTGVYYWGEKFAAVGLGLNSEGTMWFLLPDEGVSPEELLQDAEAMRFLLGGYNDWENQKYLRIDLSIPKFDVSADLDLSDGLKAMGVTDVFDDAISDFTPMTDITGVYVSAASHAARVKIDEEGVEAAAFTVMMVAGNGMPPDEVVEFKADRPFLFALSDSSGLPLFLVIVNRTGISAE